MLNAKRRAHQVLARDVVGYGVACREALRQPPKLPPISEAKKREQIAADDECVADVRASVGRLLTEVIVPAALDLTAPLLQRLLELGHLERSTHCQTRPIDFRLSTVKLWSFPSTVLTPNHLNRISTRMTTKSFKRGVQTTGAHLTE